MYYTVPIQRNIKSAPASPGRSRVGPALYVFSLLEATFVDCLIQKNIIYIYPRTHAHIYVAHMNCTILCIELKYIGAQTYRTLCTVFMYINDIYVGTYVYIY